MNIFSRGQSWHNYEDLETNVLECFTYVALDVDHLSVWSNRLGEILLRIGSAIDSFFYTARASPLFENEHGIQKFRDKNEPSINDYRSFFERYYKLSQANVEVRPNGVFFKTIIPFHEFQTNHSPQWWKAYNKIKHEWYNSRKQMATLNNVLEALASLFLLNILHKDGQAWLIDEKVISGNVELYMPIESIGRMTHDEFIRVALPDALKMSKFGVPTDVEAWAISRLFEHKFRQDKDKEYHF